MKDRPILMSAPMVIATLDGRKTMTRRPCKPQPHVDKQMSGGFALNILKRNYTMDMVSGSISVNAPHISECCPYGQVGDRLWLREKWRVNNLADDLPPRELMVTHRIWYEADAPHQPHFGRLRHARHMPRWASRITLEIIGIRVERLNDISRGDAMEEGCPFPNIAQGDNPCRWFAKLWESIYGAGSWDINPWAWVIEYKRVL